ncbi:MAG: LVIVD repeat-containing protein [Aggregatilineales bacterium]
MVRWWAALALVFGIGHWQSPATLNAPVSALAVSGDRLLIGQNDQFVDATITPTDVTITHIVAIQHGAIRAIAALDNGAALVLSEAGLTALDTTDAITDFVSAGGYRMAARGERIYVAALADGVRVYNAHNGKLTLVGHILVNRPVEDVAAEGANWLWTAEGSDGIRLYDLTVPTKPTIISGSTTFSPAHLVRAAGLHLIVGYGNQLAALDTLNVKAPRQIGSVTLGGSAGAFASDAILDQTDLFVGRVDVGGQDVFHYALTSKGLSEVASEGTDGAGDVIAQHGNDLFVGSERTGLRRIHSDPTGLTPMLAWNAVDFPACALADYTPVNPSPANLSLTPHADQITLTWSAACLAGRYAVRVNGQPAGVVEQPLFNYPLSTDQSVLKWQIDALTDAGTVSGAQWTFEPGRAGYLTLPSAPNLDRVLYVPPRIVLDFSALQTPIGTLALLCVGLVFGLLIVVSGAWAIGVRAARRRERI